MPRVRDWLDGSKRWGCVVLGLASTSCAAMQRTWEFQPAVVGNDLVEPKVELCEVSRSVVEVELSLVNRSAYPAALELGRTNLTLSDGTTIEGNSDIEDVTMAGAASLLEGLGFKKPEDNRLNPGEARRFELSFRHSRRDLRRFAWMTIDLGGVSIDGTLAGLPALVLRAPQDAPMGEDI